MAAPATSNTTKTPTKKIAVSNISFRLSYLTEVISESENGRDPEADEDPGFFAGAYANAKPKGYGEQKRQERCEKNQPIGFCEHFVGSIFVCGFFNRVSR